MKAYEVEHQVRVTLDGQAVTITIRGRGKSWFGGDGLGNVGKAFGSREDAIEAEIEAVRDRLQQERIGS